MSNNGVLISKQRLMASTSLFPKLSLGNLKDSTFRTLSFHQII